MVWVHCADVYFENKKKMKLLRKNAIDLQLTMNKRNQEKFNLPFIMTTIVQVSFVSELKYIKRTTFFFTKLQESDGDNTVNFDAKMTQWVNEQLLRPIFC